MITALCLLAASAAEDFQRYVYPMAKPLPAPEIVIDVTQAPEAKEWAETARALAIEWYPTVTSLLATEKFNAPKTIRMVYKPGISAPAYASGGEITINADWIKKNPNDFGMVIHEMTHVIQQYPRNRNNTGWLVEGIADYIRWWRYEPEAPRSRIDFTKASYKDAYRTTANFLAWVTDKYDRRLVPALDRALREAKDPMPVFEEITKKSADDLWKEFASR